MAAAAGAIIALAGTLLADVRRDRSQRDHNRETDRLRHCVEFALALDEAHSALRRVAATWQQQINGLEAANQALHDAQLYAARERLLMCGTTRQVEAGEEAFFRLVDVRNAVRTGTALQSMAYHGAYHAFSESHWRFRMAVRAEFGQRLFTPAVVGRADWSDRDRCAECAMGASAA